MRRWDRWFFEHRVEWAALIGGVGFVAYLWQPDSVLRAAATRLSDDPDAVVRAGYAALAVLNALAAALRIRAGGILGGARMMSVPIRDEEWITAGPYAHVRNPIYLSDIVVLAGMGLVVPWTGALAVWILLAVVYARVMRYEEGVLSQSHGEAYDAFRDAVPRLVWRVRPYAAGRKDVSFRWREGLVNNFLYLPMVPGFAVCALTGVLWHGVAVGAIGPVGWVALHFRRNFGVEKLADRRT